MAQTDTQPEAVEGVVEDMPGTPGKGTAIVVGEGSGAALAPVESHDLSPLAILERMARDPNCDPDKLEKLMTLAERHQAGLDRAAYGEAVARFQRLCPHIPKTRTAKSSTGRMSFKFAAFEDVMEVAGPHLAECGLAVGFSSKMPADGVLEVTVTIQHGTHSESSTFACPIPKQLRVSHTQQYGAALSYAKRYALCAALNIVVKGEDKERGRTGAAAATDLTGQKTGLIAAVSAWREGCGSSLGTNAFIVAVAEDALHKPTVDTIGEVEHLRKLILVDHAYDPATAERIPEGM